MEKDKKIFGIARTSFFNGKRRVGLDTNILIKLYDQPDLFDYEQARIFNQKDTIFVHKISIWELAKYLMKSRNYNEDLARSEAKKFVNQKNIISVYYKLSKEEVKSFEEESNKRLKEDGHANLRCHYPDSIILLGFKKIGINKIISDDSALRECARFLGMDSERLPSLNIKITNELRKIFNMNRKKYNKKR